MTIRETLAQLNPDAVLYQGLDEALMGYTCPQAARAPVAVYDTDLVFRLLSGEGVVAAANEGDLEEALVDLEQKPLNVAKSWCGQKTPVLVSLCD